MLCTPTRHGNEHARTNIQSLSPSRGRCGDPVGHADRMRAVRARRVCLQMPSRGRRRCFSGSAVCELAGGIARRHRAGTSLVTVPGLRPRYERRARRAHERQFVAARKFEAASRSRFIRVPRREWRIVLSPRRVPEADRCARFHFGVDLARTIRQQQANLFGVGASAVPQRGLQENLERRRARGSRTRRSRIDLRSQSRARSVQVFLSRFRRFCRIVSALDEPSRSKRARRACPDVRCTSCR
jgi:hypothetical protein